MITISSISAILVLPFIESSFHDASAQGAETFNFNAHCDGDNRQQDSRVKSTHHSHNIKCDDAKCSANSFCYLGSCFCHPGYEGGACDIKMEAKKENMWYTTNCPNLMRKKTYDETTSLSQLGGEYFQATTSDSSPLAYAKNHKCSPLTSEQKSCAYLCYSHNSYGTAAVPTSIWKAAQTAEADLWANQGISQHTSDANDRAVEHWKAFSRFKAIPYGAVLGRVIEVGAGPWTQLKGILYVRPDLIVEEFTVWEPSAERYIREVPSCSYRSGYSLVRWDGNGSHVFPVIIKSEGGELLSSSAVAAPVQSATVSRTNRNPLKNALDAPLSSAALASHSATVTTAGHSGEKITSRHRDRSYESVVGKNGTARTLTAHSAHESVSSNRVAVRAAGDRGGNLRRSASSSMVQVAERDHNKMISTSRQFDTLVAINVIEHVQDAFKYLTGLYLALRPGGLLILHERYYDNNAIIDGDRYHPIRIKRLVLDHFLARFRVIFNNCNASFGGRKGEQGYYVIAEKRMHE